MGIPLYYSTIVQKYPHIVKKLHQVNNNCNQLFIDFNAIIHFCSNNLKQSLKLDKKIIDNDKFEDKLINLVCINTQNIIEQFNSDDLNLVYIAIDGVVPFAKIMQQKKRRFNSIHTQMRKTEDLQKINIEPFLIEAIENEWNSNNISPQTLFMQKLEKKLWKFLMNTYKLKENIKNDFDIHLSTSAEYGEGEHKIYEYIKHNQVIKAPNEPKNNIYIHGLDADLILLSMINLYTNNIYLIRQLSDIDHIELFNINDFKSSLSSYLKSKINNTQIQEIFDEQLLIYNYAFICVFLGNDFLPHLSYISLDNNGLDILLKVMIDLINNHCDNLNNDDNINIDNINNNSLLLIYDKANNKYILNNWLFNILLEKLSKIEDKEFKNYNDKFLKLKINDKNIQNIHPNMSMEQFEKYYQFLAIIEKKNISLFSTLNSWRINYYNILFPNETTYNIQQKVCHNYIEGLIWYIDYYFNQSLQTNGWFYYYNYSPTILDLYFHSSLNINYNNIFNNHSYKSYELTKDDSLIQLIYILPYGSKDIINKLTKNKYNFIYNKEHLGLYYPYKYELITYFKKNYWAGIPNIPFLDIKLLRQYM